MLAATTRSGAAETSFDWDQSLAQLERLVEDDAPAAQAALARLRAQQPAPPPARAVQLDLLDTRTTFALGQANESLALAERARDRAQQLADRVREGEAEALRARIFQECSELDRAQAAIERALKLLRDSTPPRVEAEALYRQALICGWTKRADRLLATATRLQELAAATADHRVQLWSEGATGAVFYRNERYAEAHQHFTAMLAHARVDGAVALIGISLERLATATGHLGDRRGAEVLFRESLARCRTCGHAGATLTALVNLSINLKNQQRPAEAMPLLDEAVARAGRMPTLLNRQFPFIVRSSCRLLLGQPAAALADAERAYELTHEAGTPGSESEAAQSVADAAAALGDYRRAYEMSLVVAAKEKLIADADTARQVLELETRYATERNKAEIADLNRRNQLQAAELAQRLWRQRLLALGAAVSLALAVVAGFFFLRFRRLNRQLALINSELRLARQFADAANETKSRFLANISHEIRTPMNGVVGLARLLVREPLAPAQAAMTRTILESAECLLLLLNDLLDHSKIEAGKFTLAPVTFNLRHELERTLAPLAPLAAAKGLDWRIDLAPELDLTLHGDSLRLRQVLTNLAGNAIKFTARGEVAVSVRPLAPAGGGFAFRVEVSDTGVGIPATAQPQLFQSFMQADGSSTRRFGGTGLGLAISRQLVELMHGRIGFTSAEGRGSRFWFELELPRRATVPAVAAPAADAAATFVPLHLLVAEDNEANRLVARSLFESLGHHVEFADHGEHALELLKDRHYDAVLMDCQMPVCDGYTATRRIRSGEIAGLDPHLPIIATTAHALPGDRAACLAAGMDDYVTKPLDPAELARAFATRGLHLGGQRPQAPVPPAAGTAVFDEAVLARLGALTTADGRRLDEALVTLFLHEAPARLAELQRCTSARDAAALALVAHKFAGSSAGVGAHPLRHLLRALESLAQLPDWPRIAGVLADAERQWHLLRPALESRVHPARP